MNIAQYKHYPLCKSLSVLVGVKKIITISEIIQTNGIAICLDPSFSWLIQTLSTSTQQSLRFRRVQDVITGTSALPLYSAAVQTPSVDTPLCKLRRRQRAHRGLENTGKFVRQK